MTAAKKKKQRKVRTEPETPTGPPVTINITKWQFCEGCKATVNAYSAIVASALQKLQDSGQSAGATLTIEPPTTAEVCEGTQFSKYESFMMHSCIKIFNDYTETFLRDFEGTTSPANALARGRVSSLKRNVCNMYAATHTALID